VSTSAFILDGRLLGWATLPFLTVSAILVVAAAAKSLGFLLRGTLLFGVYCSLAAFRSSSGVSRPTHR
jgi:hypothetical protein